MAGERQVHPHQIARAKFSVCPVSGRCCKRSGRLVLAGASSCNRASLPVRSHRAQLGERTAGDNRQTAWTPEEVKDFRAVVLSHREVRQNRTCSGQLRRRRACLADRVISTSNLTVSPGLAVGGRRRDLESSTAAEPLPAD